jgi:anthranilate phosphoribosyltransferase
MTESATPLARAVRVLADGGTLDEELTADAFRQVMRGEGSPALVAALLIGLRVRGEGSAEIAGAVRALREAMVTVPVADRRNLVDTCGTGGGTVRTFNVSTAAALVAAGAGALVAKHGNRSFTSRCGSADVLEALGVTIGLDATGAAELLSRARMAFLFAPVFHPAMRHVGPVRRELGVPTIMNIVGPLANPAGVSRQLIGVADADVAPLVAGALGRLGADHALVVHARSGMDEIAPAGETLAWEIRGSDVRSFTIDPTAFGLGFDNLSALAGDEPAANAERIERLLAEPDRDPGGHAVVALNAGAACYLAGLTDRIEEGVALALEALERRAGADILERLRTESAALSTSG